MVNFFRARGLIIVNLYHFWKTPNGIHRSTILYGDSMAFDHDLLKKFLKLMGEIIFFLKTKKFKTAELKNEQWLKYLAF